MRDLGATKLDARLAMEKLNLVHFRAWPVRIDLCRFQLGERLGGDQSREDGSPPVQTHVPVSGPRYILWFPLEEDEGDGVLGGGG